MFIGKTLGERDGIEPCSILSTAPTHIRPVALSLSRSGRDASPTWDPSHAADCGELEE
ncbi:hypothetical protein J7481_18915 [Labrenzia sp. R4_2]|uniref:hypothetical protein n=1 Tax=Labrenzia sp. R4_2 TaxID=2821107 RepID=UPI001ADBD621|nr:hypothetical protein [Labrenzia sp. R4_2]MBO9421585.1 hypothetical protein [Labrenzia sp. R4_2]